MNAEGSEIIQLNNLEVDKVILKKLYKQQWENLHNYTKYLN